MIVNEELKQLAENAHGFLKDRAGPKAFRAVRDQDPAEGFDVGLWQQMSELGWAGIAVPESLGGYEMGPLAVVLVAEALGAHLASAPFAGTVFAATVVSDAAKEGGAWAERLTALAEGRGLFALAIDERAHHHDLAGIQTTATSAGGSVRLAGSKRNVLDVDAADSLLVLAKTDDGLTLVDVAKNLPGVSVKTAVQLDVRRTSTVSFDNVEVERSSVIGGLGQAGPSVARGLDLARVAVAAEMLGAAKAVFDMTLDYMRDRKQFGVPIGSFQALQHRAAHVHTELTIARAAVMKAASTLAESPDNGPAAASVAKAKAASVAIHAANEAIQMHGGVGVTDEFDVGLFVKRIRTLDHAFGSHTFHADRYARLRGF